MSTTENCEAFIAKARRFGIKQAIVSQWQNAAGEWWTNISGFHLYHGRHCEESKAWHGQADLNLVAELLRGAELQVVMQ